MTNEFNLEEYIKDLSPELQEKARACKTKNELLELAADEDMEIPDDALEMVAGGYIIHRETVSCPKCGQVYPKDLGECPNCSGGGGSVVGLHCDKCGKDFNFMYELGKCPYCKADIKL